MPNRYDEASRRGYYHVVRGLQLTKFGEGPVIGLKLHQAPEC